MATSPRDVVSAAKVLGGCLIACCVVLAIGGWLAAGRIAGRIGQHDEAVRDTGGRIGDAMRQTGEAIDRHGASLVATGEKIARPEIRIVDAVPIQQPVKIRGVADDGALPVNATIGK